MNVLTHRELADLIFGTRTELILRCLGENDGKADRRTLRTTLRINYEDLIGSIRWLVLHDLISENSEENSIALTRKGYIILDKIIFRIALQQPSREKLVDLEHVFVIELMKTRPEEIVALPEGTFAIVEALSDDEKTRTSEINWLHWLYEQFFSMYKKEIPTIFYLGKATKYGLSTRHRLQAAGWTPVLSHFRIR